MDSSALQYIINKISGNRLVLFCGAGISANSGIPVVSKFLDYFLKKILLEPDQTKSIRESSLPFESIIETARRESNIEDLFKIFSSGTPSTSHRFIAKLARNKITNLICTTNFDTLIEQSLDSEGLKAGIDYLVCSADAEFSTINWETDQIKLIKIHGCITDTTNMAITLSQIASNQFSENREALLRRIFTGRFSPPVMILGYSCSDIDLFPIIKSFKDNPSEIIFVEHQLKENSVERKPLVQKKLKNPFALYPGSVIHANTDFLIRLLWKEFLQDEYISQMPNHDITWKTHIDRWYASAELDSGQGIGHHISSRLLYAIGDFRETIKHHEKAVEIALKKGDMRVYASETGNMAMAYNALNEYGKAADLLDISIPLCKKTNSIQGLSAQLQARANIFHRTGQNKESIDIYKDALEFARQENDLYAVSNILGNIGNPYNASGKFQEAITSVNAAVKISRSIGNLQALSSQLGILAMTYYLMLEFDKAINHCEEGVRIKAQIGDRNGECLMLAILMNMYLNAGKSSEVAKISKRCLFLAKQTGNTEAELKARITLGLISKEDH